nr:MAG TPA_asm: Putative antitoxin of bacterial toxin-antitoxin system, YdaS/YdaT [Caudoviricetes sp.]
MNNKVIQRAIDIAGSQKKLADRCGVAQPTVWRWLHGGGIDARYVMKIVSATEGKIKAADIRPDLAQLLSANNTAA